MKKNILTLCIALFSVFFTAAHAQREIEAPGDDEYIDEGYPGDDFDGGPKAGGDAPCTIECGNKNIQINFTINSITYSHGLIAGALKTEREQWIDRQNGILKEVIGDHFNKNFRNINDARTHMFKHFETENVKNNVRGAINKISKTISAKHGIEDKYLMNLKLLELRESEIKRGVINSLYGHLKFHKTNGISTPLKDIRSLSQINSFRNAETIGFGQNNLQLKKEESIREGLQNLYTQATGSNSYSYLIAHPLITELSNQQNSYFSRFTEWGKLDLTQLYVNNLRGRLPIVSNALFLENQIITFGEFGSNAYIEGYGFRHLGSSVSIDNLTDRLRHISLDKIITENAIIDLGERNLSFLNERPELKKAVAKYFKINDFSKIAKDCVNYLLNQLQNGQNFAPDANLYKTGGKITAQSTATPNTAIRLSLNTEAIEQGFEGFSNVLSALFLEGNYNSYEGYIIRNIFIKNGITTPTFISNEALGDAFEFTDFSSSVITISYENNNGSYLLNNGYNTSSYLNNLIQNLDSLLNLNKLTENLLFSNPEIAVEFRKFLTLNNSSEKSKKYLKTLEEVILEDCYSFAGGFTQAAVPQVNLNIRAFYYNVKDSLRELHPDWSEEKLVKETSVSLVQTGLDIIGLFPVAGEIADLVNGGIYLVRGDRLNAAISFTAMFPVIGNTAVGARLFVKVSTTFNGVKTTLRFITRADGVIEFGAYNKLAKMIKVQAGHQAHHIIPWRLRFHDIVQRAAKVGFHMNDKLNGISLKKFEKLLDIGKHGKHPAYTDYVLKKLDNFLDANRNGHALDARNYLANVLIPDLLKLIEKAKDSPLNLNEYFKTL